MAISLTLAPLSWGEEIAFFCSTERATKIMRYSDDFETDTNWHLFPPKVVVNEAEKTGTVSGNIFGSGKGVRESN